MKLLLTVVALSTLAVLLFGCSSDAGYTPTHRHHEPGQGTGSLSHNTLIHLSLEQLVDVSELVVKGSPVGKTTLNKRPAQSADYPSHLRALHADLTQQIGKTSFRVDQYYKGSGPSEIFVMSDDSTLYPWVDIEEGTDYVLFLFRPDSDEGKTYWEHGYLIQGVQGLWTVKGDKAVRDDGFVNSMGVSELVDLIEGVVSGEIEVPEEEDVDYDDPVDSDGTSGSGDDS